MIADGLAGELFRVLADPTRRALFERIVAGGEVPVGALVSGSRVSQPAVSQHLAALRSVGLVAERRAGRNVLYRAPPEALQPIAAWLGRHGSRLDAGGGAQPRADEGGHAAVVHRGPVDPP